MQKQKEILEVENTLICVMMREGITQDEVIEFVLEHSGTLRKLSTEIVEAFSVKA